ncbi:hypothetical protein T492DRAFT_831549 [Pavlovales sp. CCMP2436]|nr:hypothetical protein T492DRAFT_831549 [Pavlovales sp. CCMP2436]
MVKGHPTIAVEMAKTCGMLPLIGVQYYIDNFVTIIKETSEFYSADADNISDDGDVKMFFNAIIYGGGFTTWEKAQSDPTKVDEIKKLRNTTMRLDFITNLKINIVRFNNEVYKNNRGLIAKVTKESKTPYEKKVLLLKNGIMLPYRYRLEYDGLCIPPFRVEYDKDRLIEEINTHIYETTGLAISFKFKNYKPEMFILNLDIPFIEEVKPYVKLANDDNHAAVIILEELKDSLIYYERQLFYKKRTPLATADNTNNNIYIKLRTTTKEYLENPDHDVIEQIKESIYDHLFGDDCQTALSRAFAGHCEDKNFIEYCGNRNCGKDIQSDILKAAFGDNVNSFELGYFLYIYFLYNRMTPASSDPTPILKCWILDLQIVRLTISRDAQQ